EATDARPTSDNVRISGIRLDGGMAPDPFSAEGQPGVRGIWVRSSRNVEIDHNEIYGFHGSAIDVNDEQGRISLTEANTVWVHDNYIHHNQQPSKDNCVNLLDKAHAG